MLHYCYSRACTIDLGQSVVITGGWDLDPEKIVTQYYEDGSFNELPQLITGRYWHGCSSYVDGNGNVVSIISLSRQSWSCNTTFVQVLLVTAGWDGDNYLSSTEIQLTRTSEWKKVQPYPLSVQGLRGATINNVVYMTGQLYLNKTNKHGCAHTRRKRSTVKLIEPQSD